MHLILYGPEGSGKGTQAEILSKKFNIPIYTSGDLVREEAKNNKGQLGDVCRNALTSGTYVPDREMFLLWRNKLQTEEAVKGFILDGFPRNKKQAQFLIERVSKYGYGIDRFIYLCLSDEESIKRLSLRHRILFEGSNINHDDPVRVKQRLSAFRNQENELVAYFKDKGLLLNVNAQGTVEEVFSRIENGLKS